ncbi:hypothetical protein [Prosthecobacter sp.]|uniref:hypothetical protein n=1 Tax=Prosthecobacter sp. TaxID=1965333 RepID=UPI002AB9E86C|nr:hypothetical protein [Prosthecobacter sp.]MDZ4405763.1 hypothetical protein [Prosthecobacter sp.]
MRRVSTALNRRNEARRMFRAAISTTHAILWRIHGASAITLAAVWLKARFRTTRTVELPALAWTAKLLRLLTAFRTMFGSTPHHRRTIVMHRPATLRELLRAGALRTGVEVFAFATTRTLRLTGSLWTARIVAIPLTWRIYRTALSIALRLFTTRAISVALTFHLRTTLTFTAGTIVTPLIVSTRWIYRAAIAIPLWLLATRAISLALAIHLRTTRSFVTRTIFCTRRIYRPAIAIALWLLTTWTISLTLTFHLWTALWFTRVFRTGRIVFTALAFARLIATRLFTLWCCIVTPTSFGGGRCVRLRCFSGRLVRRFGFLGLQRSDAEGNSAAKPCE